MYVSSIMLMAFLCLCLSTQDMQLKQHRDMQHVIIESMNTAFYANLWLQMSSAH